MAPSWAAAAASLCHLVAKKATISRGSYVRMQQNARSDRYWTMDLLLFSPSSSSSSRGEETKNETKVMGKKSPGRSEKNKNNDPGSTVVPHIKQLPFSSGLKFSPLNFFFSLYFSANVVSKTMNGPT